jgi:SUF system NifU family Fe-S assembly protein
MSDVRDLYQTVILDHYKKPRNYGRPAGADREALGVNPLCGDHVRVYARMEGDRLTEVGFEGSGCAISTAAASLMTQIVKGRSRAEVEELYRHFHELVTGTGSPDPAALGKLEVLAGVREFPARVKCATLVWHALRAALEGSADPVSTEPGPAGASTEVS